MAFSKTLHYFFLLAILSVGLLENRVHGMIQPNDTTEALLWVQSTDEAKIKAAIESFGLFAGDKKTEKAIQHLAENSNKIEFLEKEILFDLCDTLADENKAVKSIVSIVGYFTKQLEQTKYLEKVSKYDLYQFFYLCKKLINKNQKEAIDHTVTAIAHLATKKDDLTKFTDNQTKQLISDLEKELLEKLEEEEKEALKKNIETITTYLTPEEKPEEEAFQKIKSLDEYEISRGLEWFEANAREDKTKDAIEYLGENLDKIKRDRTKEKLFSFCLVLFQNIENKTAEENIVKIVLHFAKKDELLKIERNMTRRMFFWLCGILIKDNNKVAIEPSTKIVEHFATNPTIIDTQAEQDPIQGNDIGNTTKEKLFFLCLTLVGKAKENQLENNLTRAIESSVKIIQNFAKEKELEKITRDNTRVNLFKLCKILVEENQAIEPSTDITIYFSNFLKRDPTRKSLDIRGVNRLYRFSLLAKKLVEKIDVVPEGKKGDLLKAAKKIAKRVEPSVGSIPEEQENVEKLLELIKQKEQELSGSQEKSATDALNWVKGADEMKIIEGIRLFENKFKENDFMSKATEAIDHLAKNRSKLNFFQHDSLENLFMLCKSLVKENVAIKSIVKIVEHFAQEENLKKVSGYDYVFYTVDLIQLCTTLIKKTKETEQTEAIKYLTAIVKHFAYSETAIKNAMPIVEYFADQNNRKRDSNEQLLYILMLSLELVKNIEKVQHEEKRLLLKKAKKILKIKTRKQDEDDHIYKNIPQIQNELSNLIIQKEQTLPEASPLEQQAKTLQQSLGDLTKSITNLKEQLSTAKNALQP